jgi:hypothetical protein
MEIFFIQFATCQKQEMYILVWVKTPVGRHNFGDHDVDGRLLRIIKEDMTSIELA